MKKSGYVLVEILAAAAIAGLFLSMVIMQVGDSQKRLQQQQLNLAARRFIMECRKVQQYNMYVNSGDRLKIVVGKGNSYYTVGVLGEAATQYKLASEGCGDIIFDTSAEILFSPLGSVNESAYIEMKHKDNDSVKLTLNLQPVTGRLEIAE